MNRIDDLNKINYQTNPEGRLLFAAIVELTTKLHTDKTPNQVIDRLNEIAVRNDETNIASMDGDRTLSVKKSTPGDCSFQAKQPLSHFEKLILKATEDKNRDQRGIESDLKVASSIILEKAAASFPPDKYTQLEQHLVDLFMLYVK